MNRGTTPTHTFNIPFDVAIIDKIRITYAQCDKVVLVKSKDDCRMDGTVISLKLSQADTLMFEGNKVVSIQLTVVTTGGDCLKSDILCVGVRECLDEGVI